MEKTIDTLEGVVEDIIYKNDGHPSNLSKREA